MTYTLTCPDPNCAHEFTHEADPAVLEAGDFDLITCPECNEPWEADYDPVSDTLELVPDDEESDDEDGDFEDDEE